MIYKYTVICSLGYSVTAFDATIGTRCVKYILSVANNCGNIHVRFSTFLPRDALLSAVYAVVVCLLQRDRPRHLSVEILQLQNISLENAIVWHYLRDSTFSLFDTIPEYDRHTHTDRRTDTRRRHIPHLA